MSQSCSKEGQAVKELLSLSEQPYKRMVSGMEELDVSAWRPVRPRAVYDLTATPPRRKALAQVRAVGNRTRPYLHPVTSRNTDPASYMSGEIDEDFNYVYKASSNQSKQSNRPSTRPLPPTPPSTAKVRSILASMNFDPAAPYHTTPQMSTEDSRLELARIVAMQLKPELLVEQLMIENRLRCMNLENHQQLNLEGVGVDPKSIHQLDKGAWLRAVKSKSTPALGSVQTNSHRKFRRRRNMPNNLALDWCTLNPSTDDLLSRRNHFTSEGKVYVGVDTSQPQTTQYRLPQLPSQSRDPLQAMRPQPGPLGPPQPMRSQHEPLNLPRTSTISQFHHNPHSQHGPLSMVTPERGVGQSLHMPVVAPALAPERAGLGPRLTQIGIGMGQYWHQTPVKHVNKLKSLGWR